MVKEAVDRTHDKAVRTVGSRPSPGLHSPSTETFAEEDEFRKWQNYFKTLYLHKKWPPWHRDPSG